MELIRQGRATEILAVRVYKSGADKIRAAAQTYDTTLTAVVLSALAAAEIIGKEDIPGAMETRITEGQA